MKNRKKRKWNYKKVFLLLLLILLISYFNINFDFSSILNVFSNLKNSSNYKIIKQDTNPNYAGVGQEKIANQDGYFTTFTTEENYKKTYKEYKQNGSASWSNKSYWGGSMAENGCGITALATILSGYGQNFSPEELRKKYDPVLDSTRISSELYSKFGITNSDFYYDSSHLSNQFIENHLKTNRPVLVCIWNKPTENRWTTTSHYMVLLATDSKGMVYVSNPNGLENNSKSSGWYPINEITNFLAKALYIESYE